MKITKRQLRRMILTEVFGFGSNLNAKGIKDGEYRNTGQGSGNTLIFDGFNIVLKRHSIRGDYEKNKYIAIIKDGKLTGIKIDFGFDDEEPELWGPVWDNGKGVKKVEVKK